VHARALVTGCVALAALLLWLWGSRGDRGDAAGALHASAPSDDTSVAAPGPGAARFDSEHVQAPRTPSQDAPTDEHVATPAPTASDTRSVTIRPVDRQGRSLTTDQTSAAAIQPNALRLELWSLDGTRVMDDATFRGAPLVLAFHAGVERGFVTLEDRRRRDGARAAWFPDPEQHGARRDVIGEWTGVEVDAGAELDIEFAPGGEIRGTVVCPLTLVADTLEVWVRRASRAGSREREVEQLAPVSVAEVDANGAFVLIGLDAGRCRLELLRAGGRVPLYTIDDVDVRLDEVCTDPRLARVDLTAELDAITLNVVDLAGAPLHGALAVLRAGDGYEANADSPFSAPTDAPAQLHVLLPRGLGTPPLEEPLIVVARAGFEPAVLEPPFGDRVVALAPLLPLTVRPREPFEAERGDLGFWLRLHRADAPRALEDLWAVELPEDSFGDTKPPVWTPALPLTVNAPGPGRYELDVLVRRRVQWQFLTGSSDRYVGTGVFVEIAATGGAVVIDVPSDLAAFRAPR
jgi:hypothetical protein